MDWSYATGLFDGEGSITLYFTITRLRLKVEFSCSDDILRNELINFLKDQGIDCRVTSSRNKLGRSVKVSIEKWDSLMIIVPNLSQRAIAKRKHLAVANEVLLLRNSILQRNETLLSHLAEFDALRHKLHALATKGVKTLKPWHRV